MPETGEKKRSYIAIDLKSFYASVECMERGLDPLDANLVVADTSRSEKTICLAVTPALKAYGIPGRARLFEVIRAVQEINIDRKRLAPGHRFTGKAYFASELRADPSKELDFLAATPQMAKYMSVSAKIFNIYRKYVSEEDIHVYSIDEVFIDVTSYLRTYGMTARELAVKMIRDVLSETRITATAGIAPNMYLCKAAMDIVAKRIPADEDGVRIAELDERSYRELLWDHRPLTDFWRVGRGYAKKLQENGMFTMGDIARMSLENEDLLYRLFGVNAELLIDHAWGYEPCTIADVKQYKPGDSSVQNGQVLPRPYSVEEGRIIVKEMADQLSLDLVRRKAYADQLVLYIGYEGERSASGRGSVNLDGFTSSSRQIIRAASGLYDRITDSGLKVRRLFLTACHVTPEEKIKDRAAPMQFSLFTDYDEAEAEAEKKKNSDASERRLQEALLKIKDKYGKNAVLKGMDYLDEATTIERNGQIGGHKA